MLVLRGCVQPALAPVIDAAMARVLDRIGISLLRVRGGGCCGALPYHLSGEARGIVSTVAEAYPELQLTAQQRDTDAHGAIVWIGPRSDAVDLEAHFRELRGPGGEWKLTVEHGVAFVSMVGLGLGAREAVRTEAVLERVSIPLLALRTTPTALILRVPGDRWEDAVRVLHAEFVESETH